MINVINYLKRFLIIIKILELANKIFHNFNMYISKNILFVQHNLHKEKTIHNNFMNNSLKRINPNLGIISDFEPNIFE